jgi:hypothetical protein
LQVFFPVRRRFYLAKGAYYSIPNGPGTPARLGAPERDGFISPQFGLTSVLIQAGSERIQKTFDIIAGFS